MIRESWDAQEFVGQEGFVRLVDSSSDSWGHINFDDMRGDIDCNVCQRSNLCWSGVLAKTCGFEYSLRNSCF